jgi:hypothetical protein
MEPISIDTIEQADFFVWHLDVKQVEEWKENYLAKQPYITNFFNNAATFSINQQQQDFVFRCYMVIFICFNYYGYTFPKLEREEYLKVIHFWKEYFMKGGKNPTNYRRQKIYVQESKQPLLSNYIAQKLSEAKVGNQSLFTPDHPIPALNLYLLIDFLHRELEKMSDINNKGASS